MFEIRGKYNTAKVFTDNIDSSAIAQFNTIELSRYEADRGSRIKAAGIKRFRLFQ
ncbi:MAG TPA: hypothetical protein PK767_05135 [Clostridiales bacterium]|jgi:hypothetical protein|nr:hypothetical protein [Bacillota bacterium]NLP08751.1 hypothetical protein [Clostridiaceae bacterium]HOJ81094.1 hypothetical protein [Clostridiales bacterium]HOL92201.1 hypothetical protein [Clostridiales bacterium]HPP35614.1 hypothetical protein [Clostridiales bacterium]